MATITHKAVFGPERTSTKAKLQVNDLVRLANGTVRSWNGTELVRVRTQVTDGKVLGKGFKVCGTVVPLTKSHADHVAEKVAAKATRKASEPTQAELVQALVDSVEQALAALREVNV